MKIIFFGTAGAIQSKDNTNASFSVIEKKSENSNTSKYHGPNFENTLKIIEQLSDYSEDLTTMQIAENGQFLRNRFFGITFTHLK